MTIEIESTGEPLFAYVAIFSGLTVDEFTRAIDRFDNQIANWLTVLPQTVFIASPMNATALTEFLRKRVPGIKYLLVLDAHTDRNGWMPKSGWEFLRKPHRVKGEK